MLTTLVQSIEITELTESAPCRNLRATSSRSKVEICHIWQAELLVGSHYDNPIGAGESRKCVEQLLKASEKARLVEDVDWIIALHVIPRKS
ncbi:hypothetical protein ATEIFO6365_0002060500 [Aspergillus terreus]|uniref:Uncharacterized protein n=1 Tax=Aspergillus terreus TaxID=33178 RepID=A0A5M3YUW6_ASPTE|nr:hypothetical protein ATETN484_0004060500 [Aspergillus terreus]GFF13494.1 hypothetical protein ATEIFO6365_0002060500 [Aspergillus terreus]